VKGDGEALMVQARKWEFLMGWRRKNVVSPAACLPPRSDDQS